MPKPSHPAKLWMLDRLHDVLFSSVAQLGRRLQSALLRRIFRWKYRRVDPYAFSTDSCEQTKYRRTLDVLPAERFLRILEVGCSEGTFTQMLAERFPAAEIVGFDIADEAVARARVVCSLLPQVSLHQMNAIEALPVGPFDLIFCAEVLYYLGRPQRRRVRERLCDALAPGGLLVTVNFEPRATTLHGELRGDPRLSCLCDQGYLPLDGRPYAIALHRCGQRPDVSALPAIPLA